VIAGSGGSCDFVLVVLVLGKSAWGPFLDQLKTATDRPSELSRLFNLLNKRVHDRLQAGAGHLPVRSAPKGWSILRHVTPNIWRNQH
jgi:hypothetical protein